MAKQSVTEKQKAKRIFWKRHIKEWGRSGITQTEYCRQHKLSVKSFTYWKRRLSQKSSVTFVPVQVKPVTPIVAYRSSELVLHKDGYRVEIKDGFNPATLGEVLQAISKVQC